MEEKIKSLTFEPHSEDYINLRIEYEDGSSMCCSGGDIYNVMIVAIAHYEKNYYLADKIDRLMNDDNKHVGDIMRTAIKECERTIRYLLETYYTKKKKKASPLPK